MMSISISLTRLSLIACLALALWSLGVRWDSVEFWALIGLWWAHGAACEMDGMFRGALGFWRLDPAEKARAEELFRRLDQEGQGGGDQ